MGRMSADIVTTQGTALPGGLRAPKGISFGHKPPYFGHKPALQGWFFPAELKNTRICVSCVSFRPLPVQ